MTGSFEGEHGELKPIEEIAAHDNDQPSIETLLKELSTEQEGAARAELAGDLVRETSLLMDTEYSVLVSALAEHDLGPGAEELRASIERVRVVMEPVYEATHRSAPIEVHQSEPEAFERDLAVLEEAIQAHLSLERIELTELRSKLQPEERDELMEKLEAAWNTAIPEPHPPRQGLARRWARMMAALDRTDSGAQYRPARERRRDRADGPAEPSEPRP